MTDHSSAGRARGRRRLEQTQLRSIIERIADGIIVVDIDGVIRFVNPAAERLFERSADQLTATYFGFPAVAGESTEIDIVRPSGAVSVELRVVDIEWDGVPARLASLRDVTDRRRAEERTALLERERVARAEAEAASHAKSEFLAMMSHELRTPLNAVIGYSELLDLGIGGPLTPEQRQQVARIRASGRHLLGLVNEVLDLAKVEAGRLSLNVETLRVGPTADGALALVQPAAEARGIALTARCAGDIDALCEGDEDRVRQILVNLLMNAVKFTDPGGAVTLEAGTTRRYDPGARLSGGPWVYLRVSDTGVGIAAEQLMTIFDPFVQVDRGHTRANDGSGLGLTISRRLARLMNGDLTVRSTPGQGSEFTLWLPMGNRRTQRRTPPGGTPAAADRLRGLAEVGEALVRETATLVDAFVGRLRDEPVVPAAESLRYAQLADHAAAIVTTMGAMLIAVDESRGGPSSMIRDGAEIQRFIADRHGAQRARLGWSAAALRSEWECLRLEVERAMRRRAQGVSEAAFAEALTIVQRLIEEAEEASCRALERTLQESPLASPNG